jgi:hypothetical protein
MARKVEGNIAFGDPVDLVGANNTWAKCGAASNNTTFAGIAVREVKQFTGSYTSQGNGSYAANETADVIERGTVTVSCQLGTPAAGNQVYMCIAGNNAARLIGGIEAAADDNNTVALPNTVFTTGLMDGNNCVEVTILTRNKA